MRHLALSAVGRDRPGIVAAVTGVLVDHEVNVEDSRMAILRGEFAMVLILATPDGVDRDALERDLAGVREELGLEAATLAELGENALSSAPAAPTHIVSVYGADHLGIVHAVARALAEREVNIASLSTRLVDELGTDALYAMALEVTLPGGLEVTELDRSLAAVGRAQGLEVSLRELAQDAL